MLLSDLFKQRTTERMVKFRETTLEYQRAIHKWAQSHTLALVLSADRQTESVWIDGICFGAFQWDIQPRSNIIQYQFVPSESVSNRAILKLQKLVW